MGSLHTVYFDIKVQNGRGETRTPFSDLPSRYLAFQSPSEINRPRPPPTIDLGAFDALPLDTLGNSFSTRLATLTDFRRVNRQAAHLLGSHKYKAITTYALVF